MKKYIFSFNKYLIWNLKHFGKETTHKEYLKYCLISNWWSKKFNGKEIYFKKDENCVNIGSIGIIRDWCIEKEV